MVKQLEPQLNRQTKKCFNHETNPDDEAENIAIKFENIFGQCDIEPSQSEKKEPQK